MDHQMTNEPPVIVQPQEGLATFQEQILAFLPIPSAILSVCGSSVILYTAVSTRRQRTWTTYIRLLFAMPVCDIISSVSLGLAAFMRRRESERLWAVGNEATCTAAGTLIQFSYSNLFYSSMLSFYFLSTVRFGMKHTDIAKRFEPIMHIISLGFPLVTSLVGAAYGMYSETATGMGCWVNDYPRGCGDLPGQEKCRSGFIGYMFFGLPFVFCCTTIIINNLMIWFYVRKQRKPLMERSRSTRSTIALISSLFQWMKSGRSVSSSDENSMSDVNRNDSSMEGSVQEYEIFDSCSIIGRKTAHSKQNASTDEEVIVVDQKERDNQIYKDQMRRLHLVSSQAFLFVVSYAICNSWMGLQGIAEGLVEEDEEPQLMKDIFGLMVVNAIFAPLQGFFNMLVFLRPKYIKMRQQFPRESRTWAFRRAVLGDRLKPEHPIKQVSNKNEESETAPNTGLATVEQGQTPTPPSSKQQQEEEEDENLSAQNIVPLPKRTVSSLTVSLQEEEEDEEYYGGRSYRHVSRLERTTGAFDASLLEFDFHSSLEYLGHGLEAISELSESVFDPIVHTSSATFNQDYESSSSDDDGSSHTLEPSEQRWSSVTTTTNTTSQTNINNSDRSRFDEFRQDSIALSSSSLRLMAPRRVESGCEDIEDSKEQEEEDNDSHYSMETDDDDEEEIEYSLMTDAPMSMPLRKMSADKSMADSNSFHSVASSISSSCSLISFSEHSYEFGDSGEDDYDDYWGEETKTEEEVSEDAPIQAPRQKLSPRPEVVDGATR